MLVVCSWQNQCDLKSEGLLYRFTPESGLLPKSCFMNTPRLNLILCWSAWCQWVQCRGASAHKQHGCSWCRGTPQWHCQSSPVSGVLVWRPIPSYLHSASLSWGVGQEWGQTGCSLFQPSTLPALQHTQGQFYVLDSHVFTSVTLTCKVNGFFHIIFAAQGKGQGFPICHMKEWTR